MDKFYWRVKNISALFLLFALFSCATGAVLKDTTTNNNTPNPTTESLPQIPYSYRGTTGGFNVFYNTTTKAYVYPTSSGNYSVANNYKNGMNGFVETGLLGLIYDSNAKTSSNYQYQAPIVMFGTGVAAKDNDTFKNLTTKTINTLYYAEKHDQYGNTIYLIDSTNTNTTANTSTLLDASTPLVLGTNIFKPDSVNAEPSVGDDSTRYNSTTTAAIINAIAPSGVDLYKRFTTTGFSNEKIYFYTMYNSYTSGTNIASLFTTSASNSANTGTTLFYYDYFPTGYENKYAANASNVKIGINALMNTSGSTATPTYATLSSNKVFVTAMGSVPYYTTGGVYLNNTSGNSFASNAIDSFFQNKSTYNIMDSNNKFSVPITAVGVVKYCSDANTCASQNYYLPDTEYNAGALKNLTISVPTSPSSVIYNYNIASNTIRTSLSGAQPSYIDVKQFNYTTNSYKYSATPELSFNRQAAAILTATIGAYQKLGVTARNALSIILQNSTPMYSTNIASGVASVIDKVVNGDTGNYTNSDFALFSPSFIFLSKADAASVSASFKAYNAETANTNAVLTNEFQNDDYGLLTSTITSNDILIYDATKVQNSGYGISSYQITAMNDIWLGKTIAQYNSNGSVATAKTVTSIIYNGTGYYYCFDNNLTACVTPKQRIASNTYGLGLLNAPDLKSLYDGYTAIAGTESAIAPSNKLSISAMVMSAPFGNTLTQSDLTSTIQATNSSGESWRDTLNMNQRISNATQSPIFNSVSNLAYSQYSSQNYATSLGNFGAFSANFSSNNTNFGVDTNNPLNNSRFSDMASVSSYSMNGYGVIYDQSSTQTRLSNIAYSGSIFGTNFISRMNFQSGMDLDKVQNYNPMQASSINYNPFLSLVSNQSDAKAFQISQNIGNYSKFAITTTVGTNAFNGNSVILDTPQNSANLATIASVNVGNVNSQLGLEAGILRESRTLLGSYSSGALSLGQNNSTFFSKIKTTKNLFGNTNFIGAISFGQTTANPDSNSFFSDISPIISRSFVAGLNTKFFGGNLEFTYSQPLAILGGGGVFNGLNRQFISFKTTSFEEDFGISFQKSSQNSSFSLQMLYIQNRGNINSQNTFGGVLRFTKQL